MMKNKYIALLFLAASTLYTSCTSKLDELPDKRMTLRTPSDVKRLLVTAYPETYMAAILEMYSDNTDELISPSWTSFDESYEQMYFWKDNIGVGYAEGPTVLFNGSYGAISAANEAIAFAESQKDPSAYSEELGEAYLCRAYAMFHLSNIFCLAYSPKTANTALGMPYPLKAETELGVHYDRGTLEQLYKNVESDLLKGLSLVGSTYTHPKYHFTPEAANAFAARFYLYYRKYDKAIEYATKVLGSNPVSKLRNWKEWDEVPKNDQWQPDAYIKKDNKANLLILSTRGALGLILGPALAGQRFVPGEVLANTEGVKANSPWGGANNVYLGTFSNPSSSKVLLRKIPLFLTRTDAAGNNGQPYSTYVPFNTDETLMVRAEAYALTGQYDKALADLNSELKVLAKTPTTLTLESIKKFYKGISYYTPMSPTPKKKFHADFDIEPETQEPLLQAILQMRRLLTMHEGLRMQDVKRYGITIYRRQILQSGKIIAPTDSLTASDPRLAVQLPVETIKAGLQANPRNTK